MARRPRRKTATPEPDTVHREMLEHLEENPPPPAAAKSSGPPKKAPAKRAGSRPSSPPSRPRVMLRHLGRDLALSRREAFLALHRHQGHLEVVVVVGRGRGSGPEGPVLGPAVREFCRRRTDLVAKVEAATGREGGDGALVLRLIPSRGA